MYKGIGKRRIRGKRLWPIGLGLVVPAITASALAATQPAAETTSTQDTTSRPITYSAGESISNRNTLKQFDFDERRFGNVEEIPMYWLRRKGPNLPHYNKGGFDHEIGHNAPLPFGWTPSQRASRSLTRAMTSPSNPATVTAFRAGSAHTISTTAGPASPLPT